MTDDRYMRDNPVLLQWDHHGSCEAWGIEGCGCPQVAALPHQCGYWGIGGPDDVRALIADLTSLLERWPS